jgi:hypothetical protein
LVSSSGPVLASSTKTACGAATVEIRKDNMRIGLDSRFPRVLSYEVEGRGRLLGAQAANLTSSVGAVLVRSCICWSLASA